VKVFLAGATGVLGQRLVPLLVGAGHSVAGMTRSADKRAVLTSLGAEPVVCDVYAPDDVIRVVAAFGPDLVMHQLTDLPDDAAEVPRFADANARIRRIGTRNLIVAADAAGVPRFIAQSVAWKLPGDSGAAVAEMESMVLARGGVVIRYGQFYGPGTFHEHGPPVPPRIAIDAAAERTVALLDAPTGVVTVVDE
jgi:nucleoside-diphosphate-sugar epimerase